MDEDSRSPHRGPPRSLRSNTTPSASLSAPLSASPSCGPTGTSAYNLRSNTAHSAAPFTAQQLFLHICNAILHAEDSKEIICENIAPEIGSLVTVSLANEPRIERALPRIHFNAASGVLRVLIMPTEIHNVHVQWLKNELWFMTVAQFLSPPEFLFLELNVGTRFTGFSGVYTGSSKEPDLLLRPDTHGSLPRVIVESGWSESWPHLEADKNLWFSGGLDVAYVILLKWTRIANGYVTGLIEVWHRNPAGAVIQLHREVNAGYGTSGFSINSSGLEWNAEDGFGGWLVCDWWHNAPQIFYLVEYYQPELPLSCNKVQLKPEYIFI
ncbi:hypothetical protein DTO166G4_4630 [Paecilomyces variotii]|nr:hypothetical protein DTO032I3_2311 [Paecilomyces variotii]KAJ9213699.1 hypothetical protein DTO166G4_4630 [Paecilomyces variotii]KAJ9236228.1 hypothetical protein DTO169E5_5785 [Paecilomyces variotii]KAJ9238139.1 hypothetical protein DTO166G5_3041 [Paecilomyces variotii]KAJ9255056.1 hypothetical protein DTO207G8_3240 [Paecilomyces variotii]